MKSSRPFDALIWLVVWQVAWLHILWGTLLAFGQGPTEVTAINALTEFFGHLSVAHHHHLTTIALFAVAITAVYGMRRDASFLWLLPQQALLVVSAYGAVEAMYLSQFADGVDRPRAFLVADQSPVILMALTHTFAIVGIHWRRH